MSARRRDLLAVDTSVAVPLLVATHDAHADVMRRSRGRDLALCGHAVAESYSVLTRLPDGICVAPTDVGIAGGAVYDAMIGLAAVAHDRPLATRDRRASDTYELVGATVEFAV